METINDIELRDEHIEPGEQVLKKVLGESYLAYQKLLDLYNENAMTPEWRYYRDGKAWLCKVQKKKKTIVWMSAWKGYMQATIYFREGFAPDMDALNLQEQTKERILSAKKVGKSVPFIFEIRDETVLEDFRKVMQEKIGFNTIRTPKSAERGENHEVS